MATEAVPMRATLEDLYRTEGPAELVGGRIIRDMTGDRPAEVAGNIYVSLRAHAKKTGKGKAKQDGTGYVARVEATDRESFCPDASYHTLPPPSNPMRFLVGMPDYGAEVRSEHDYGKAAERRLAEKRADYFTAGAKVVWDVDPVAEVIYKYTAEMPEEPTIFRRGDVADAEPAVPGWRSSVDEVFAKD